MSGITPQGYSSGGSVSLQRESMSDMESRREQHIKCMKGINAELSVLKTKYDLDKNMPTKEYQETRQELVFKKNKHEEEALKIKKILKEKRNDIIIGNADKSQILLYLNTEIIKIRRELSLLSETIQSAINKGL